MGKKKSKLPAGVKKTAGKIQKASKTSKTDAELTREGKKATKAAENILNQALSSLGMASSPKKGKGKGKGKGRGRARTPVGPPPNVAVGSFFITNPNMSTVEPQRQAAQQVRVTFNTAFMSDYMKKKKAGTLKLFRGKALGPLGEWGDDVVIKVALNPAIGGKQVPKELTISSLRVLIRGMYDKIFEKAQEIIHKYVPKETGNLQDSMIGKVQQAARVIDSFHPSSPFVMHLGTPEIKYAKPVNKMPTGWVQHKGGVNWMSTRRHRAYRVPGHPLLDDPTARSVGKGGGGYYDLTLLDIRQEAKKQWLIVRNKSLLPQFKLLQDAGVITSAQNDINKYLKVTVPGLLKP